MYWISSVRLLAGKSGLASSTVGAVLIGAIGCSVSIRKGRFLYMCGATVKPVFEPSRIV
ncbi:Uncharacterised protein [Bordetella pertussis]|nr:Uncharacterised protein [Bordetella pertussis]CFO73451.1 Uncharacterised protein [Bordetella pertussis]CFU83487.1 Uncharacterised protein [Bordetella pertussis]CPI06012.1 Uncharacterised protein [Bordetella pertussis]CPK96290.1 Uncharacterised protein [Bordetella pertussis]